MNRLDGKTVITIIGVISLMIFAFIFTIGYILSNIDPKNKLEGYTIAISFIGIFATFGGAYLGAKISANNALKIVERETNANLFFLIQYLTKIYYIYRELGLKFTMIGPDGVENVDIYKRLKHLENINKNYLEDVNKNYDEILSLLEKVVNSRDLFYLIEKTEDIEFDKLDKLCKRIKEEKEEVNKMMKTGKYSAFNNLLFNEQYNSNESTLHKIKEEIISINI